VGPAAQFLDVVYHAELGLDEHVETIYRENDMDPITQRVIPQVGNPVADKGSDLPIAGGSNVAERPETFVMFQPGSIEQRVIHDDSRVERRRDEREREALAQRYSAYAQGTDSPVTFAQFEEIMRKLRD
jgi:hypothetical protein